MTCKINYSTSSFVLISFAFISDYISLASCESRNFTTFSSLTRGLNGRHHKTEQHYQDRNITNLLDAILLGYDNHLRPDFGGPPVEVFIDLEVRSMGPISEIDMSYSMDCYFRQEWKDSRLAYDPKEYRGSPTTLALSITMLDKIWKPDTYFYNGKAAYIHTITNPNKFVRIGSDGMVRYSSRLTVKASCPMHLESFPMDTQRCPLEVGSFGYNAKEVVYRWNVNRTVVIASDMKMSQFNLQSNPSGNITNNFRKGGPYSRLVVSFHFKRLMGSFIIEVYAPSILLVVMSWVSFWINREATADRISLGIMTILTMTFLGLETRNDLPKVSYMTALDYFAAIAFAFIFATILQFALVHYFTKVGSGEYYFPPPECINNVSGKIEWNLTSAQIKVKKENERKMKEEEEKKKEREEEEKKREGSERYQTSDHPSSPTLLSSEEDVKGKRVQLPLLDAVTYSNNGELSTNVNYSSFRQARSATSAGHEVMKGNDLDADVEGGGGRRRGGRGRMKDQVVAPRLRSNIDDHSHRHGRNDGYSSLSNEDILNKMTSSNLEPKRSLTFSGSNLEPKRSLTFSGSNLEPERSLTFSGSNLEPKRSREGMNQRQLEEEDGRKKKTLSSISSLTTCEQSPFISSSFIPSSSFHPHSTSKREEEYLPLSSSSHKALSSPFTTLPSFHHEISYLEEEEETEETRRKQEEEEEEEQTRRKEEEEELMVRILMLGELVDPTLLGPNQEFDVCPVHGKIIPLSRQNQILPTPGQLVSSVFTNSYPRGGKERFRVDQNWIVQQEPFDPQLIHRKNGRTRQEISTISGVQVTNEPERIIEPDSKELGRRIESDSKEPERRLQSDSKEPERRLQSDSKEPVMSSSFNRFSSFRESVNQRLKSLSGSSSGMNTKRSVTIGSNTGHTISFQLNSVSNIDKVSRIIFPLAFLVTNFLYWTTYLADDN